jgi:hypothetical protein
METKTYWNFGDPQTPAEAMELLAAVLEYVYKVIAENDLERDVEPQLCRLQETVTELRCRLERGQNISDLTCR